MKRVVQCAFLDLERAASGVLDPARDGVAMARPPGESLENEHVERTLEEIEAVVVHRQSLAVRRKSVVGRSGCRSLGESKSVP